MDEEIDGFDFVLAEKLRLTQGQLEEMPNAEYLQWRAFNAWRADLQEREIGKSKHG